MVKDDIQPDELRDAPVGSPPAASAALENAGEKSWGDRLKRHVFTKGTYFGINYLFNAFGSALLTYIVTRNFDTQLRSMAQRSGQKLGTLTNTNVQKMSGGIYMTIRAFFLTTVGNLLVPVIKWMEDRRQRIEFKAGHVLDRLQEAVGRSNSASRRNLADYEKIHSAMQAGSTAELSTEEKERFLRKYRVEKDETGHLQFREYILPWHKVVAARFVGWFAALVTNYGFGRTESNSNPWLNYKHYEGIAAPKIDSWFVRKVPGFARTLADTQLFAKFLFNDALLTVSSSVTHKVVQGMLHKEQSLEERGEETPPTPAAEARKKRIEEGVKDHRTRAAERSEESEMVRM